LFFQTIRKRRAATLEKLDETGVNKGGPVDTSKLKIADFVHYNPISNPMEYVFILFSIYIFSTFSLFHSE
jgi:hypothetical protein